MRKTTKTKQTKKQMKKKEMQKEMVLELLDTGWKTHEIAECMHLSVQSVAAYKAHKTMGRY